MTSNHNYKNLMMITAPSQEQLINYFYTLTFSQNLTPDHTSAIRIILLPSGQIIWSTCDLTRSHVKSCVRRPF